MTSLYGHYVSLLCLLIFLSTITGQIQKNRRCPKTCTCTPVELFCENTQATSTDFLATIFPLVYSELETLSVRGNAWGDISRSPLLPSKESPEKVNKLDLSDNAITKLSYDTLRQFSTVQTLNLSANEIQYVSGDIFANMPRLRELYLNDAFSKSMSPVLKADIIRRMFSADSRNKFAELRHVELDHNALELVHPESFCALTGLTTLSLNNNRLTKYPVSDQCRPGPRKLLLRDNEIENINDGDLKLWKENMVHLQTIDVSHNLFQCDCKIKAFLQWYKVQSSVESGILNEDETRCATATPAHYTGTTLLDTPIDKLRCSGEPAPDTDDEQDEVPASTSPTIGGSALRSLFYIGLMAVSVTVIFILYRRWRQNMRKRQSSSSNQPQAYFVGGYRKLFDESDGSHAEFV